MSSIRTRKLKPLASRYCTHYRTRANFFIAIIDRSPLRRNLLVRYENRAGFGAGIPEDWSEEKVLLLIRTSWRGTYPIWEVSSRVYGSPVLIGEPSFVAGQPSWHFGQSEAASCCRRRLETQIIDISVK
jgi:hypothetical protein